MTRERQPSSLVPLPASQPRRFESWDEAVHLRTYEIWSSIGNRDAAQTHRLLQQECGLETPLPAVTTIREWARVEAWSARADADLEHSHGRTFYELQAGWFRRLPAQKVC